MKQNKVSELAGATLDEVVAMAEGNPDMARGGFSPSSRWMDAGPIIERERIRVQHDVDDYSTTEEPWYAEAGVFWAVGPTPLVAAMRAYVASRFGYPEELP